MILAELPKNTNDNHLYIAGSGVVELKPEEPFFMLVANFGKTPKLLFLKQKIAKARPHPTTIIESQISNAEIVGVM